jgi:hypothetical protein
MDMYPVDEVLIDYSATRQANPHVKIEGVEEG